MVTQSINWPVKSGALLSITDVITIWFINFLLTQWQNVAQSPSTVFKSFFIIFNKGILLGKNSKDIQCSHPTRKAPVSYLNRHVRILQDALNIILWLFPVTSFFFSNEAITSITFAYILHSGICITKPQKYHGQFTEPKSCNKDILYYHCRHANASIINTCTWHFYRNDYYYYPIKASKAT